MSSAHILLSQDLYQWLLKRTDSELPRLTAIGQELPGRFADAHAVSGAFTALQVNGLVVLRHGTRSQHRGHYAVQIVATGAVLKTKGCPFDPPMLRVAA